MKPKRSSPRRKPIALPAPPDRTYAGSPRELLAALSQVAEWPQPKQGVLAQRTRKQENASGERAAAAHDLIAGLEAHLDPSAEVQLFLDESRPAPRPPDRRGRTQAVVRRSSRTRIRLTARLQAGHAFKAEVGVARTTRREPGTYEVDEENERTGKWIAGRVKEAWITQVTLRLRVPPDSLATLNLDELAWLAGPPAWTKEAQLALEEDVLVSSGTCHGIATPHQLAEWIVPLVVALATQRKPPTDSPAATDRDVIGLFSNLVLAALVDQHLDPSEVAFLSSRARWLGLSTAHAQRLAAAVTSGQITEFYRPEDPLACRVTFRQVVQALHADGELEAREQKLIRFLARGLDINQGDLAQALREVPPGPGWSFLGA